MKNEQNHLFLLKGNLKKVTAENINRKIFPVPLEYYWISFPFCPFITMLGSLPMVHNDPYIIPFSLDHTTLF